MRNAWLSAMAIVLLAVLLAGCAKPIPNSAEAICAGTLEMRKEHARALARMPLGMGVESALTGQRLLSAIHHACEE